MLAVGAVAITALYPLAVWFGQGRVEPRYLALLLLLAALARLPALRASVSARWAVAAALLLAGVAILNNALLPLKLYPVLVNALLLAAFGASLASPQSLVERLARLTEPDLPAHAVAYTRSVTKLWCGFFVVNGSIALYTALWASDAVWSLYNGGIAYALMGVLFGGELLVRQHVKKRERNHHA